MRFSIGKKITNHHLCYSRVLMNKFKNNTRHWLQNPILCHLYLPIFS